MSSVSIESEPEGVLVSVSNRVGPCVCLSPGQEEPVRLPVGHGGAGVRGADG